MPVTTSTTAAPMSMPVLEYCTFVPGSKRSGEAAATAAFCLRGAPPDQPPPLMSGLLAHVSNGKPPVWLRHMRTVRTFFALTSVLTPLVSPPFTQRVANSGRYLETGSSRLIFPSSTSFAIVTPQKPFVCEHCM